MPLLVSLLLGVGWAAPPRWDLPLSGVSASAGILIDLETGTVLWEHHARERRYPASLTKLMTGLLVVERGDLNRLATISKRAAETGETGIDLEADEKLTVGQLLHACLIRSANDAAVALAESTSGSLTRFVSDMNRRAAELGATDTHFVNPHGLHDPEHYSTAEDLATIAREALRHPEFSDIVRKTEVQLPWASKDCNRVLHTTNKLLLRWDLCDGVKTGYTRQAGNCLAASATKEGWRLLAVVLHSDYGKSWSDARRVLEAGFAHYERRLAVRGGEEWEQRLPVMRARQRCVPVAPGTTLVVVPRGATVTHSVHWSQLIAPLDAGQGVGTVSYHCRGQVVARAQLVARDAVPLSLWWRLRPSLIRLLLVVILLVGVRLLYGTLAEDYRGRWSDQQKRRRGVDRGRSRHGQRSRAENPRHQG